MQLINKKRAVSLVEVAISALILGIVVIVFLGASATIRINTENAKHRTKAMNLLRAKMEWVKGQAPSTIESWIGNPIVENDVDNTIGSDELHDDTITTSVDYYNSMLRVGITLNWAKWSLVGVKTKGDADNPDEQLATLISP